jgi:hypothetical protein
MFGYRHTVKRHHATPDDFILSRLLRFALQNAARW